MSGICIANEPWVRKVCRRNQFPRDLRVEKNVDQSRSSWSLRYHEWSEDSWLPLSTGQVNQSEGFLIRNRTMSWRRDLRMFDATRRICWIECRLAHSPCVDLTQAHHLSCTFLATIFTPIIIHTTSSFQPIIQDYGLPSNFKTWLRTERAAYDGNCSRQDWWNDSWSFQDRAAQSHHLFGPEIFPEEIPHHRLCVRISAASSRDRPLPQQRQALSWWWRYWVCAAHDPC